MKIALLRVGVDTGCGGIHGPLMKDGTFVYIPIPDDNGLDDRTYGNFKVGGMPLAHYFPERRKREVETMSIHFDPEFKTFTYGDPTAPKAGLRRLLKGDILVFYCGLEGWDSRSEPALYVIGYFVVEMAGYANQFPESTLRRRFAANWHVKHADSIRNLMMQKEPLVLIKGSTGSRLLKTAHCISEIGKNVKGQPLKIVSKRMRKVFGGFAGHISLQRSPPRWIVDERFVRSTVRWLKSLH